MRIELTAKRTINPYRSDIAVRIQPTPTAPGACGGATYWLVVEEVSDLQQQSEYVLERLVILKSLDPLLQVHHGLGDLLRGQMSRGVSRGRGVSEITMGRHRPRGVGVGH